jgi:benzaldehyde dehydrogenase (NAD)
LDIGSRKHHLVVGRIQTYRKGVVDQCRRLGEIPIEGDLNMTTETSLEPTVIAGVTPGMAAFDEEIFGPVAPISTFRSDDEAIALANATEYGLVAAVVSSNLARAQYVADGLRSGVVHINDQTVVHGVYGPIGGVGSSGNGFSHSTLTNANQFSEWQWITARPKIPTYSF